jgi:hypothetical protein
MANYTLRVIAESRHFPAKWHLLDSAWVWELATILLKMQGCSALGCLNHSENSVLLIYFPSGKDLE